MSDNLEKIRRGHEGFTRGDLAPVRGTVAEDVDWGTTGSFPGLEPAYRGPEALEIWMESVRSAWESFVVWADEVIHDAGDVIVLEEGLRGRGRGSGAEVEMRIFVTYWFESGKIVRRRAFDSRREAVEAAGLRE